MLPQKPALFAIFFSLLSVYVHANELAPDEFRKLLSAPTQLELMGRNLVLETSIWLDRMPRIFDPNRPSPECSKEGPLNVKVSIIATNLAEFPTGVKADRLWILKGNKWWGGSFSENESKISNNRLDTVARGCPPHFTEADMLVDLVVRIIDDKGNIYFLRAPDQKVQVVF